MDGAFFEYMRFGGFPGLPRMEYREEKAKKVQEGIFYTVLGKELERIRNRREAERKHCTVTDVILLKRMAELLAGRAGDPISMKRIAEELRVTGKNVSADKVSGYVSALTESLLVYPADRMDVRRKQILRTNRKWYPADPGMGEFLQPRRKRDWGASLENVVYLELRRRDYEVFAGRFRDGEIDFVARKGGVYSYVQVAADLTAESTFEREIRPLRAVKDNYEKTILTLDRFTEGNYEGILVKNVVDWLLE